MLLAGAPITCPMRTTEISVGAFVGRKQSNQRPKCKNPVRNIPMGGAKCLSDCLVRMAKRKRKLGDKNTKHNKKRKKKQRKQKKEKKDNPHDISFCSLMEFWHILGKSRTGARGSNRRLCQCLVRLSCTAPSADNNGNQLADSNLLGRKTQPKNKRSVKSTEAAERRVIYCHYNHL
jgi:hypothetical protein